MTSRSDLAGIIIVGALFLLTLGGWVANLAKVFNHDGVDGELVVRVIGILFAPLGAILGYF